MKKVLIIVYYWPPSGGGGVQRWLKFCNLLPENGWQPIVYVPEDPDYPLLDESLEAEVSEQVQVIKRPIWEPRKLYSRFLGKKKETSDAKGPSADEVFYHEASERSWKQNLALWIRGNFFIPDARAPWIQPSIKYLSQYLKENPVDAIVTSGPPHSLHLIGRGLKKRLAVPWIADFRDAWTEIEFFEKLMLSKWANRRHHKLERAVLAEADISLVTADYWPELYAKRGARRVEVLLNGYDENDFPTPRPSTAEAFIISHVGTLAFDRNPMALWEALSELCDESEAFSKLLRIHFAGKTDSMVKESINKLGMGDKMKDYGYISHEEAVMMMCTSPLLLLLINKSEQNAMGRVPGKVFEYMAAIRPILCLGPEDSSISRILTQAQAGTCIPYQEKERLKREIKSQFDDFQQGKDSLHPTAIEQYSR
jgi:glycosyltransferase involved in cell wall biosynthesis